MSTEPKRVLIDKEKIDVNGMEAYRLYFFDEMTGFIIKVISFVSERELVLAVPPAPIKTYVNPNIQEVQNIISESNANSNLHTEIKQ